MRDETREHRRAQRVRSKGSVDLGDGMRRLHHRMHDVSVNGIRTTGESDWPTDEQLSLDLTFDATPTKHYALTGRVCRVHGEVLALELDEVPEDLETQIIEEIVAAMARDGEPNIILVHVKSPMRAAIAAAFRNHGCVVTEVSTPLEAIRQIIGDRFEPSVIAIADTVPESVAENLREFLAGEYPDTELLAIGASTVQRDPTSSWLDSENPSNDLDARVACFVTSNNGRARPRTERGRG